MRRTFGEGTVLIRGERFDVRAATEACHRLITTLGLRFGPTVKIVAVAPGDVPRPQPEPRMLDFARGFWEACATRYDVNVDAAINFGIGPVTAKACLLGRDWCIYDEAGGLLSTHDGRPAQMIDAEPMLCIFGPMMGRAYRAPTSALITEVEKLLSDDIARLGLTFEKGQIIRHPDVDDDGQAAYIGFPARRYGRGKDWLRVRCTTPEGAPVLPSRDGE